jgi:hypothetical protein
MRDVYCGIHVLVRFLTYLVLSFTCCQAEEGNGDTSDLGVPWGAVRVAACRGFYNAALN